MAGTLGDAVLTFLFGRERTRTLSFLAVAAGVAALFGGGPLVAERLSVEFSTTRYFQALFVVTAVAAAVNAYDNGGLLVSWSLAAAGLLPFALTFALTDAPIGREPTLANATSELLGSAGLYGVVVGTGGFVVGAGVRRLLDPEGGRTNGTDPSADRPDGTDES